MPPPRFELSILAVTYADWTPFSDRYLAGEIQRPILLVASFVPSRSKFDEISNFDKQFGLAKWFEHSNLALHLDREISAVNLLVFPHQLFAKHPGFSRGPARVDLIEDSLFFGDDYYPMKFHKQKLWLHRAKMKRFETMVQENGYATLYLDYGSRPDSLHHHLENVVDA